MSTMPPVSAAIAHAEVRRDQIEAIEQVRVERGGQAAEVEGVGVSACPEERADSPGAEPRMTSWPRSKGERATDGRLSTAASASPRVPGMRRTSSPASDTRAIFRARAARAPCSRTSRSSSATESSGRSALRWRRASRASAGSCDRARRGRRDGAAVGEPEGEAAVGRGRRSGQRGAGSSTAITATASSGVRVPRSRTLPRTRMGGAGRPGSGGGETGRGRGPGARGRDRVKA